MQAGAWDTENLDKIHKLLDGPPGAAAFDFDNTLIYNDLGEAVMHYLSLQGMLRGDREDFWEALRHPIIPPDTIHSLRETFERAQKDDDEELYLEFVQKLFEFYVVIAGQIGLEAAYRWSRIFFGGHKVKELRSMSEHVLAYEMEQALGESELPSGYKIPSGIRIYEEIRELIQEMVKRDWEVWIVTASPRPIIQTVIKEWGLPEERVLGMLMEEDPEDSETLRPAIIEPMTFGQGKVTHLRGMTDTPLRFAAGDSWTDFALLLHAENGLLIDKGNDQLRKRAQQSGFWIQPRFINPISVDSTKSGPVEI